MIEAILVTILLLVMVGGLIYFFILPVTANDEKWLIQQIRNKYAYRFARMENISFESFLAIKEMENAEIEELKAKLRKQ